MLPTPHLEEIIREQNERFVAQDPGIARDIDLEYYRNTSRIVVVSGVRRSGKSTLLRQFAALYPAFLYVNFDDDRLMGFAVTDFSALTLVLSKMSDETRVIFIDEIQNIPGWERFVRRIHDEGYKVFLTGSNAHLLSAELGTHLTGRYTQITLYPFSFKEVLRFRGISVDRMTQKKRALILREFDRYIDTGGFPEFVKTGDWDVLKRTHDDILFRDVIVRFGIREVRTFRQLSQYLFTNIANMVSYNALKKTLGIRSVTSVRDYLGFLREAYLVFEIFRYDYSLKKQHVNEKKCYAVDNGMRNAVAFRFSEDRGRLLENLVFIELSRRGESVYFFKDSGECDFIIEDRGKIISAVQVCFNLVLENRERELSGLVKTMQAFHLDEGVILTYNQEETILYEGVSIRIEPAWMWLLGVDKE
ncbi:MAG: ATP-binding protein [Methanoregula sp.]|nr:ATP-binding protein [Methanoregula sp.]